MSAETCDECRSYAKVLYQAQDPDVDPVADDLATLGLDLLVAEADWARHALSPFRTANAASITLVAVARDDGFEVFTHPQRIAIETASFVA
jgi:formate dehydrogenase maturation protein FdhE